MVRESKKTCSSYREDAGSTVIWPSVTFLCLLAQLWKQLSTTALMQNCILQVWPRDEGSVKKKLMLPSFRRNLIRITRSSLPFLFLHAAIFSIFFIFSPVLHLCRKSQCPLFSLSLHFLVHVCLFLSCYTKNWMGKEHSLNRMWPKSSRDIFISNIP